MGRVWLEAATLAHTSVSKCDVKKSRREKSGTAPRKNSPLRTDRGACAGGPRAELDPSIKIKADECFTDDLVANIV
jgi:hypothetical protein